jgi:hypothetical protein
MILASSEAFMGESPDAKGNDHRSLLFDWLLFVGRYEKVEYGVSCCRSYQASAARFSLRSYLLKSPMTCQNDRRLFGTIFDMSQMSPRSPTVGESRKNRQGYHSLGLQIICQSELSDTPLMPNMAERSENPR